MVAACAIVGIVMGILVVTLSSLFTIPIIRLKILAPFLPVPQEIGRVPPANMSIGMLCTGSQFDLVPFLVMGNALQKQGHRVRLVSHESFRSQVLSSGVEFYPLAAESHQIKQIVKNNGDGKSNVVNDVMTSYWKAMTTMNASSSGAANGRGDISDNEEKPFQPHVIIANPTAFGHSTIAEKLHVPLHIVSGRPWIETGEIIHPLAKRLKRRAKSSHANVVQSLKWQNMANDLNNFRAFLNMPLIQEKDFKRTQKSTPRSFVWSKELLPQPSEWNDLMQVTGSIRSPLDEKQAKEYIPSERLKAFLALDGNATIYVGFGNMDIDNFRDVAFQLLNAVHRSNVRLIFEEGVNKFPKWGWKRLLGWGIPNHVYVLEKAVPHAWLFEQVSAVIHHGGAETTTAALYAGKPQLITPFLGDQLIWGDRVYRADIGLPPRRIQSMSSVDFRRSFHDLIHSDLQAHAIEMAHRVRQEDGVNTLLGHFYRSLPPWEYVSMGERNSIHWKLKGDEQSSFAPTPENVQK